MTQASDRELVERCRAEADGEAEGRRAFRSLYERHVGEVLRLGRRLLGDEEAARDVAQEAFVRLHRAIGAGRYDPEGPLRPYLLGIARNAAVAALRRRSKERAGALGDLEPAAAAGGGLERALRRERADLVGEALAALAPEHRSAVLLRHAHGLKLREVAVALDCTERTVRNRLRAAAVLFARELERRGLLEGAPEAPKEGEA